MTNFQVYKKTLPFSLLMFLIDILALLIVVSLCSLFFFIMNKTTDMALIGLAIGLVLGIVIAVLIKLFVTNRLKAAQIAMMVMGVVDNKIPDNVISSGLSEVKGRFARLTLFFIVTSAIKGIFRQIGKGINRVGRAVGGDVGESVTSAINSAIEVLIGYLCDCCLGWVMYNKQKGVAEAACEGAVIFFKRGKTLIRNIGRIFGMGLLSFVVIAGGIFGLSYLIMRNFPTMFETLGREIAEISTRNDLDIPSAFSNPTYLTLFICGIFGIIMWTTIHSVLIRPFILVGVLRNFMSAGLEENITEADFNDLSNKSPKFAKLRNTI